MKDLWSKGKVNGFSRFTHERSLYLSARTAEFRFEHVLLYFRLLFLSRFRLLFYFSLIRAFFGSLMKLMRNLMLLNFLQVLLLMFLPNVFLRDVLLRWFLRAVFFLIFVLDFRLFIFLVGIIALHFPNFFSGRWKFILTWFIMLVSRTLRFIVALLRSTFRSLLNGLLVRLILVIILLSRNCFNLFGVALRGVRI